MAIGAWCRARPVALLAAAAVGFAAGGVVLASASWARVWPSPLRAALEQRSPATGQAGGPLARAGTSLGVWALEGRLQGDASASRDGASLLLEVDRLEQDSTFGVARLFVAGAPALTRAPDWRDGRRVRVTAALRRPVRYFDPGVPDGEVALARRGISVVGTVKSAMLVEVVGRGWRWQEVASTARAFARQAIVSAVGRWSARSAGIVAAGDRSTLDPDVQRTLQEAGTYHVIAISGGNIAILAGVVLSAWSIVGRRGRGALIGASVGLLVYAYVVGGGVSVARATYMAVAQMTARAFDLRGSPLNALAVAAVVVALADPLGATEPAFLLTFGATAALLVAAAVSWAPAAVGASAVGVTPLPTGRPGRLQASRAGQAARSLFLASLAVEVGLLPVGARYFSRVTFAGLALNFAAVPLMGVAQVAGMLVPAVAWWSPSTAAACGSVVDVARRAAAMGRAGRVLRWARRADCRLAVDAQRAAGRHRSRGLVDADRAGSSADRAWRWAAARDLRGCRTRRCRHRALPARRLDGLLLSHADTDHIGGAAAVVRDFAPRVVWEGIPVPAWPAWTAARREAARAGTQWSALHALDRWQVDGVDLLVHHPPPPDWERQRPRNDDSLVVELRWQRVSIVLAGDIGREAEREVAPRLSPSPLRVLKVPHHGSLTSSSWAFIAAAPA